MLVNISNVPTQEQCHPEVEYTECVTQGRGGHTTQLESVLSGHDDIVSLFPAFPDETIR